MAVMFSYPFLDSSYLMEPLRENTVAVDIEDESSYCSGSSMASSSCHLSWSLTGVKDSSNVISGCSDSNTFTITPPSTGQYSLAISFQCADASYAEVGTYSVWVKYVRREVRTLTDDDREEFLDAFRTLWDVSTVAGKKLYGHKYKSLFYLASIHNDAGSAPVCDEFHGIDGFGFANNHIVLGSYLEQSLQLVNPRVCLHYIDYFDMFSSESYFNTHLQNTLDGGSWNEVLTDKYFGTNDPYTGRIINSRWENSSIPTVDEAFFAREGIDNTKPFFEAEAADWVLGDSTQYHHMSPTGLLRAPWNFNNAAYTTRYNNVNRLSFSELGILDLYLYEGATCDMLEDYITIDVVGQPMESMLTTAEDESHGNIHFAFGGSGGEHCVAIDKVLQSEYGFSTKDLLVISVMSQKFFKTASPYTDADTGTCTDEYFEREDLMLELVDSFFSAIMGAQTKTYFYDTTLSFATRKAAMQLICDRHQYDSDMEGSGAATDPLFWVGHGNVERLLQKIMLTDVMSDKVYPTKTDGICSGHAYNGTKSWLKGFYFEDESVPAHSMTNEDLLTVLDPTGDSYQEYISYVYDSSKWTCDGFDSWFETDTTARARTRV